MKRSVFILILFLSCPLFAATKFDLKVSSKQLSFTLIKDGIKSFSYKDNQISKTVLITKCNQGIVNSFFNKFEIARSKHNIILPKNINRGVNVNFNGKVTKIASSSPWAKVLLSMPKRVLILAMRNKSKCTNF